MTVEKMLYTISNQSFGFFLEDKKIANEQYIANCGRNSPAALSGNKTFSLQASIPLSSAEKLNSLLSALLLCNGRIMSSESNHSYFRFTFKSSQYEWAHFCYQQLALYLPEIYIEKQRNNDARNKLGYTEHIVIQSPPCEVAKEIHPLWYQGGSKILPLPFIEQFINEQALSWWYQNCGHLKAKENGTLEKLILSTEQWNEEELPLLQYVLNKKFHLLFSIDGQRRLLLYDQLQINHFLAIIAPWIHPIFSYKTKNTTYLKAIAKRTTIRLPNQISLAKPTAEINHIVKQYADLITITDENFQRLNYARKENNKSTRYQVGLTEQNRNILCRLQADTGLTLGEIVQECFEQHNFVSPRPLDTLQDLSTTQHNIMLGSIIADGMLTHKKSKYKGIRSSYHEHFSIKQKEYRAWKVMKLKPYLSFIPRGDHIISKTGDLWSRLEEVMYSEKIEGKNRIKQLPLSVLDKLDDLHSLATIYMDDGSLLLTTRINHNHKKIYITPHVALYLQSFTYDELLLLQRQMKKLTIVKFRLTKLPSGNGYYLRTSRTADTLQFLQDIEHIAVTCPSMSYKTNWQFRFYLEKQKWHQKHPNYQVIVSDRKRMRPYTTDEINSLCHMKLAGKTDQQIADAPGRSYWSIVYKISELRLQNLL